MNPDTARTAAAFAVVASIITLVLLTASGCRQFEAYVAVTLLAVMAWVVGATQDP